MPQCRNHAYAIIITITAGITCGSKILSECKFNKMYRLNLPQYEIKVKGKNGKTTIFDILRRKFVSLTPEEWVRQHFIHFLMEHKGYPAALLANEIELTCGQKRLRCDSVLYNACARPRMIIEYKSPETVLTQKVFDQISAYNMLLKADYLTISNGIQHYCCKMDYENRKYVFLKDIPDYQDLQETDRP